MSARPDVQILRVIARQAMLERHLQPELPAAALLSAAALLLQHRVGGPFDAIVG